MDKMSWKISSIYSHLCIGRCALKNPPSVSPGNPLRLVSVDLRLARISLYLLGNGWHVVIMWPTVTSDLARSWHQKKLSISRIHQCKTLVPDPLLGTFHTCTGITKEMSSKVNENIVCWLLCSCRLLPKGSGLLCL